MRLEDYEITIYAGDSRPPDAAAVERFVIRPDDPWFGQPEQEVVRRSLRRELPGIFDCWIVARDGDAPVSAAWLHLGEDCYRTGQLGYVLTDEAHRGKGLARTLCGRLAELAGQSGCRIMLLGTNNPTAARVYQSVGFEAWYGVTMCWPAGAPDKAPVSYGDGGAVRRARWSDFATIVRFILDPQPQTVIDCAEGLTRENGRLAQPRCASTGLALLTRADRPGNAMWVLASDKGQIQGLASILRGPDDGAPAARLELSVHAQCRAAGVELARRAIEWAREKGITDLTAVTGSADETHLACLRAGGLQAVEDDTLDPSLTKLVCTTERPPE